MPHIGTLNRGLGAPISRSARSGHAAPRRAGARRSGSWRTSIRFCACIGTMNPPLTPPRWGTDSTPTNACSPPGRGRGWVGSWRAPSAARPCIGTMNLPGRRWERRRLAGEDAGAPRPGSWKAAIRFCACIGTMNPPLTPPRRGTDRTRTNACSPLGRCRGWVGSWRASFRFGACIGTRNRGKRRPAGRTPSASRSPRRSATARQRLECVELAPAFARGSWRASYRFCACMGTRNRD